MHGALEDGVLVDTGGHIAQQEALQAELVEAAILSEPPVDYTHERPDMMPADAGSGRPGTGPDSPGVKDQLGADLKDQVDPWQEQSRGHSVT